MADISQWTNSAGSQPHYSEGMAPSAVNDDGRQVMAAVRRWYDDAEWINPGYTPSYSTATSFTLVGDRTSLFHYGRRLKLNDGANTYYGHVTSNTYSANTLVNVSLSVSGSLTTSLSGVSVGLISFNNDSTPRGKNNVIYASDYPLFSNALIAAAGKELVIDASVTLDMTATITSTISLRPSNPGVINANGKTITISAPVVGNPMHQWLSGFAGGTDLTFSRKAVDFLRPEWVGADPTDTNDSYASILIILKVAASMFSGGKPYVPVMFKGNGVYKVTSGLPLVKGMAWITEERQGAQIHCTGSTPAIFTATYSAGTFTDNLDATGSTVANGTKAANNCSISNIAVDHTGTISGNAPSGAAYTAAVQLAGAYDADIINLRVDSATAGIGGIHAKISWRIKLVNPIATRGSTVTGGKGIFIDKQCNNFKMENPSSLGSGVSNSWTTGISIEQNGEGLNSGEIVNPNIEYCFDGQGTALHISATGVNVRGGYIENYNTALELGKVAGDAARGCRIDKVFFGTGSNEEYFCRLNSAHENYIDPVFQNSPTYISAFFLSAATAYNSGNTIVIHANDADAFTPICTDIGVNGSNYLVAQTTPVLVPAMGLNAGRNLLKVIGLGDYGDQRTYAEYITGTTVNRMDRHFNTLGLIDGITAPGTVSSKAQIYVDTADGDLKVKFGDGTVKTIVVDT